MLRGDIYWHTFSPPNKRRPVLILTRTSAIAGLQAVVVASITTTIREIDSEVYLTPVDDGMTKECVVNFDNLVTIPKTDLSEHITTLSAERMEDVDTAIAFALGMNRFL